MSIDFIPIWALLLGTIICVMASIEAGYQLGSSVHRKSPDETESPVSAMTGAMLGLAAFILAFTFGMVTDRYDARKELVRNEANAVRTAALRADFLPEPDRGEAKQLFREYLDARLALVQARQLEGEHVEKFATRTDQIQDRLWEMAVVNARKDMNSDVAALYIDSLNEVINIHALRIAVGLQARVPAGIWLVLYIITILGMMGVGYQTGIAGSRRSRARPILALAFALVFVLIAALDRPDSGFISVTQQPLIDLRNSMEPE